MTVAQVLAEVRELSLEEQREVAKALTYLLVEPFPASPRSLREYRGLGAHLYDGIDAQEDLNSLRDEWDRKS